MIKKLKSKSGFTFTELLAAVTILALILTAIAASVPAAVRSYREITAAAEAQVLCSTISTAVADELRYGERPGLSENGQVVFNTRLPYTRLLKTTWPFSERPGLSP